MMGEVQLEYFEGKTPIDAVRRRLVPYIETPVRIRMHYRGTGHDECCGVVLVDDDGNFGLSEFIDRPLDITKIHFKKRDFEIATLNHVNAEGKILPCPRPEQEFVAASVTTDELLEQKLDDRKADRLFYATNRFTGKVERKVLETDI